MSSGNPGSFDRSRLPFGYGFGRGTNIIRCTPPPTLETAKIDDNMYAQYYDEIERRRNPMSSLPAGVRPPSNRQPLRTAGSKNNFRKQFLASPVAATLDGTVIKTDVHNSREQLHYEGDRAEQCNAPSADAFNWDARASCIAPEGQDSPKMQIEWRPCMKLGECETKRRGNSTRWDESIVRGYIDIAHALLRHFEEALSAKQRLTVGSLQCAETVCREMQGIQDASPKLVLLVQRISAAIELLHKRKQSDERDAARMEIPQAEIAYPGLCRVGSVSLPSGYNAPIYTPQQTMIGGRQQLRGFHEGGNRDTAFGDDHPDHYSMAASYSPRVSPCSAQPQRWNSGPAGLQLPSSRELLQPSQADFQGTSLGPPYLSNSSHVHPVDQVLRRTATDAPIAAPSRRCEERKMEGADPLLLQANMAAPSPRPPMSIVTPSRPEQMQRSYSVTLHAHGVVPNVSEHTGVLYRAPMSPRSFKQEPEGPLRTHLVGSKAEREGALSREQRLGVKPFADSEGCRTFRPWILSETITLPKEKKADLNIGDDHEDIVNEALSLIKYAIDLIMSGEGPAFVSKQFFRYARSKDGSAFSTRPRIEKGTSAAQGKYILLRYTIATLEAEYGGSPGATDPNLYLRDLRRMKELLLGSDPRLRPRNASRTSSDAGDQAEGLNSLPERSPEERMERHLPLTILTLPATGLRLERVQQRPSQENTSPVHAEAALTASQREFAQPAPPLVSKPSIREASRASFAASSMKSASLPASAPVLSSPQPVMSLPLPVTSLPQPVTSLLQPVTSLLQPVTSLPQPVTEPPSAAGRSLQISESPLSILSPASSTVSLKSQEPLDVEDRTESGSVGSALLSPRRQPTQPQPSSISGLLAGRKSSESLEKPVRLPTNQGVMASTASRLSVGLRGEELKLSTSSIVRDDQSGMVTSIVFGPPKETRGPSVINMAASQALLSISASRASQSSLPDIPGTCGNENHSSRSNT